MRQALKERPLIFPRFLFQSSIRGFSFCGDKRWIKSDLSTRPLFQSSIRGFSFCGLIKAWRRDDSTNLFQSSIRGFSFCGRDLNGQQIWPQLKDFNPLYEALVFVASFSKSAKLRQPTNFNPLYEALVFAAWSPVSTERFGTTISILYTRL